MDKTQLYQQEWLLLSREVRAKLAEMFNLRQDTSTEVCNNQVVCDGYSNQMLANMSLEAINDKGIDGLEFLEAFANLLKSLEPKKDVEEEAIVSKPLTVIDDAILIGDAKLPAKTKK